MTPFLLVALIAIALLLARRLPGRAPVERLSRCLDGRWMPYALGLLTALIVWWVWGSLSQVSVYHDEAAYVLQAALFASGRWAGVARPLPAFFEQSAVLVTPVLAPKMPPGHAIVMVPGIWLGLPGLMQVVLSGIAGALLFALARRVANAWVALVAWFFWITAPGVLVWHAAYFSEATTGALWLAGWWALLEWRDTHRRRWLLILAACVGWGAITRPLTMLVYAIPVGVVVVWLVIRRRAWRDLALAMALGTAILGILPLWSARTTGSWRTTPLALYNQQYMPWDVPGFGARTTPPLRTLPPDLEQVHSVFRWMHEQYSLSAVPHALKRRLWFIQGDMWSRWRKPLEVLAAIGVIALTTEGAFAAATSALLVLAYLSYAYSPNWTVYYVEIQPVLAFLTALGCWWLMTRGVALLEHGHTSRHPSDPHAVRMAMLLVVLLTLLPALADVWRVHERDIVMTSYHRSFRTLLAHVPAAKSIVFVRYSPDHIGHYSLVRNTPDLERARVWTVYDRGAENVRLMRLAPGRTPYLYDEAHHALIQLSADSSAVVATTP